MTQLECIVMPGRLIGMGRFAECSLRVVRFTPSGSEHFEYRGITIEEAPPDLPEGRYELAFDAQVRVVQRLCGKWVNHFWNA